MAVSYFVGGFWPARVSTALLAERLSTFSVFGTVPFMAAGALVFASWLVLSAFDARCYEWSLVPLWVQVL
jgi:hypothetical protein